MICRKVRGDVDKRTHNYGETEGVSYCYSTQNETHQLEKPACPAEKGERH